MKILTDQDVYASTVEFLRGLGHEVETANERGMSRAADYELLAVASAEGRLLVTRDRHYGGLVFARGLGAGVIYLRVLPTAVPEVHAELERVLALYPLDDLLSTFVVVEPGRHRVRRPMSDS